MAATKFTEAEREKLFAQLEAPFDPALIKWRVMRTFDNGRSGVILPFADPRAYTDRLNELFTPSGWTREYTISTVPSLCRMERGKVDRHQQGAGCDRRDDHAAGQPHRHRRRVGRPRKCSYFGGCPGL